MARSSPKKLLLVIDDDPEIRDLIRDLVPRGEFDVITAADGEEGCRIFRERRVDLVIADIFMPKQDGLETLMEIQRTNSRTRVIVMSGCGMRFDQGLKMAQLLGAWKTLAKPFTPAELVETISEAVRRK